MMKIIKYIVSKLIIIYLKIKGLDVNQNLRITNIPNLKINGKANNIKIGAAEILGKIDLRNRENGKIVIENNCKIEGECRLVSARDGIIKIGNGTTITKGAVINGGGNVLVGEHCILGPNIIINANEHVFKKGKLIKEQGFIHKDVIIGNDCWFGANVVINKGVKIKNGTVIGALSLVNKDTDENSVNVGIPSKKIDERKN